jgi:hypothetical protein
MGRLQARRRDLVIDPGISADLHHYVRKTQLRTWIAVGSTVLLLGAFAVLMSFWAVSRITTMLVIDLGVMLAIVYSGVLHMKIMQPMRMRRQLLDAKKAFWLESDGLISSLYRLQTEEINERGGEHKADLHVKLFLLIAAIARLQAVIDQMGSSASKEEVQARRDGMAAIIDNVTSDIESALSPE